MGGSETTVPSSAQHRGKSRRFVVVPAAPAEDVDAGGLDAGQAVGALGVAAQRCHDAMGKRRHNAAQQVGVVAQADRHGALEGQDPLAERDGRQPMVDHQGGTLGHAAADAGGADSATLARERNGKLLGAATAAGHDKAVAKVAARHEGRQLAGDEARKVGSAFLDALHEGGQCSRTIASASQAWVWRGA